jgi:hypothetical protein
MATNTNLPDYADSFKIASLGLYGHNVISTGETSVTGRVYHALQVLSDCTVSYDSAFPTEIAVNTDATVTSLPLTKGTTIFLGCAKNIEIAGADGKVIAHLISITD